MTTVILHTTEGDIAFLLEDCNDNAGSTSAYDIVYKRLTINTITGGRYLPLNNN